MAAASRSAPYVAWSRAGIPGGRFALAWLAGAVYCAVSTATRVVLSLTALRAGQIECADLPAVWITGLGYDVVTSLYLCAPLVAYLLAAPAALYRRRAHRVAAFCGFVLAVYGFIYLAAVEYFFFDEFNARFNFVAVEYLIYPHEVFVNIWQSYPVGRALLASGLGAGAFVWLLRRRLDAALGHASRLQERVLPAAVFAAGLTAAHGAVDIDSGRAHRNRVADELSANGIYAFFDAAFNSRLDYGQFYLNLPAADAAARARRLVSQPNASFIAGSRNPLARHVAYAGAPKPLHVVVVLEESLGAEFVAAYGDGRNLTPNLDRLARNGLVFAQTYATGTRTVRGMEAVTASFPPVPAEAIIKRSHNEDMFNWSSVMRAYGYSPVFIYGGYGTFDNMNYFFSNNGYRVIDRTSMDKAAFSNIWGVSDEDLFRNALAVFDAQQARGERLFAVVMTTSNHKPFTFPAGVSGVKPSGGGRESGVRYADHALGTFVDELKKRPYFDDTLLVVVADHGARAYGREDIPLATYEIPFVVYSPRHVRPGRVDTLTSQIDVAPTVLGLLNMSYDSTFFGRDVLAGGDYLALLNHNRDIALLRHGRLSELGFRGTRKTLAYDSRARRQTPVTDDAEATSDAASLYQVAYELYRTRGYTLH